VLQLCFYTEAIASIQHATSEKMQVLLGIRERRTLRHADFAAYYRRVRAGFLAALGHRAPTEPYQIEYCALCEFRRYVTSDGSRKITCCWWPGSGAGRSTTCGRRASTR
jgi:hypothetical protein